MSTNETPPYQPIENYGVIGNLCSAALISLDCSVDFFCFPRFDSPTVFAALLDSEIGGRFSLRPKLREMRTKQMYVAETNVLVTRFLSKEASVEVTDFMPVTATSQKNLLVRMVRCSHGQVEFEMRCSPAFDYARAGHELVMSDEGALFHPTAENIAPMRLQSTAALTKDGQSVTAEFVLQKDEAAVFTFGDHELEEGAPLDFATVDRDLNETLRYWRDWSGKSNYRGRWRETVNRSALVLKLLTARESGALVAAPTFGLPEHAGGERNWDYRYTWMRDSAFMLYAFMRLGYRDEAEQFFQWLRRHIKVEAENGVSPMKVMYGIDGESDLPECELTNLSGYLDSRPVRIGNGAVDQLQLDIYGEVFDAVYLFSKYGHSLPHDGWNNIKRLLSWLKDHWRDPDGGIWELRSGEQHLLHSRLMCWVAFDRAIRLAHKRSLSAPFPEWYAERDAIVDDIYQNFWSDERQSFVQAQGSTKVDGAILLMPLMRFISPLDPRWLSTLDAIEKELAEDAFVYRYRNAEGDDGLGGEEGSFTACSFWFVECLARADRLEKARLLFEKLLAHGNHLGLFSEEIGRDGSQLGNFPQALTHLALISAATYLDRALSRSDKGPWE